MRPNENNIQYAFLPEDKVEMNFSDNDNNNQNKPEQNNNQPNGVPAQKKPKGYISVIIFALAFILVIVLMLYYFVFRNSTPTVSYSQNDIVYNIDLNHDGKADVTSEGYPDFSTKDNEGIVNGSFVIGDTGTTSAVIMAGSTKEGDVSEPGTLAKYLINAPTYNTTLGVTKLYSFQDVYTLSGTYSLLRNGVKTTYRYSSTINESYYRNYIVPIVNYTQTSVTVDSVTSFTSYYVYNSTFLFATESTSSISSWVIPLVFGIFILILVFYFINKMYKSMGAGSGPGAMSGFVEGVARKQTGSKVRFADVAGCDEAKAELVEMVDYLHSTDKYTRLGAKLPHGVLLVGPPGTGKTLLAKAVAGEGNVPFYSISGSDFVEMYVGVGASRVRSLFKTAKKNAPCLIFIDEIDAVGRQRGAGLGGGNDEREQTLNELLVEMDGFEDNSGIIVMAATNRSDVLDPALTRPGRFDRNITVDLPDRLGRAAILKVHARNKKLSPEINFDVIAGRTVGFSGADLANIMNEAAILAVRANRAVITTPDIDEAIDRAIAGPAKKSHLEDSERKQVAYHESGHAVIGIFLPYSDVVQKITIIPRGRTGGHVLMTPSQDHFLMTKNQLMARITGYLGGRTSEEIFFGDVSTGASNDIEVATNIARSMVTQYGMSELGLIQYERPGGSVFLGRDYTSNQTNYSTNIAFEIDKAVRKIIDECHEQARKLLTEHKEDVELIAETLIKNETITSDQIDYLLKNRKLPEENTHVLATANGLIPKNSQNIIIYPGYETFYTAVDKIVEGNPSRLVVVVPGGYDISQAEYKKACTEGAKDPKRVGMLFVDEQQSRSISLSTESFAQHIETYAGVPVLLIKTTEKSIESLKSIFIPAPVAEAASEVIEKADSKDAEEVKSEVTTEAEPVKGEEVSESEKTNDKEQDVTNSQNEEKED